MDNTIKIDKYRIMSILSLVFGAVAVAISFLPFGRGFGLLLGIAAVAMGAISLDKAKRELTDLSDVRSLKGMAIAGIVLGSLSIVIAILAAIIGGFMLMHVFKGGHLGQMDFHNMPGLRRFK